MTTPRPSPAPRRPDGGERPPGPVLAVRGGPASGTASVRRAIAEHLEARGLAVATPVPGADPRERRAVLASLLARHDVVLAEGSGWGSLPAVWVAAKGESPPAESPDVVAVVRRDDVRRAALLAAVDAWLPRAWREPPVRAAVLVGGGSRRMGRPKAGLELDGRTFLERAVAALSRRAGSVVLVGAGPVPAVCARLPRLPDPPGLAGPLAGILGAMRRDPEATWIVAGCDQPLVDAAAVDWLLDLRAPGRWAILPRLADGRPEPLLAVYDARARAVLEAMAEAGRLAPRELAGHPRTVLPAPPPDLAPAWRNVNTPEELAALRAEREQRAAPAERRRGRGPARDA